MGDFAIDSLPPGTYKVLLHQPGQSLTARSTVEITDSDRTGTILQPYVPCEITLHVTVEGRKTPPFIFASLHRDGVNAVAMAEVHNGTATFQTIEPGKYLLHFQMGGVFVASVKMGGKPVNPRALDVSGSEMALDVVLSPNLAKVEGDVVPADLNQPQDWKSIQVALIPITAAERDSGLPYIRLDRSIRPLRDCFCSPLGKYRLYAGVSLRAEDSEGSATSQGYWSLQTPGD